MRAQTVRQGLAALMMLAFTSMLVAAQSAASRVEAATLKNPVAANPESLAAGEKVYMKSCRGCHARDGSGGPPKDTGEEPASNLIDAEWNHGSTDGEIFFVIRNGVPPSLVMEPWDDRLSETDTWNVVNYIRTLSKAK